jgi:hypothetical protein
MTGITCRYRPRANIDTVWRPPMRSGFTYVSLMRFLASFVPIAQVTPLIDVCEPTIECPQYQQYLVIRYTLILAVTQR